ncbi:peptide-methionine (S)-S-oxide reductase MsrA [Actinomadura meridiana]
MFGFAKTQLVTPEKALPGRDEPLPVPSRHEVLDAPLAPPFPDGAEIAEFALGCFWGAERKFWETPGVISTAAGYEGGYTPNPTYEEVCSGQTAHAEAVRVVYDPTKITYTDLLRVFWEAHDPTQGMRQGNDVGTQYRSAIFYRTETQQKEAEASRAAYQQVLTRSTYGPITTEITAATPFYYAEHYHQQYLSANKNPGGYCGLGGTGLSCPVGVAPAE